MKRQSGENIKNINEMLRKRRRPKVTLQKKMLKGGTMMICETNKQFKLSNVELY